MSEPNRRGRFSESTQNPAPELLDIDETAQVTHTPAHLAVEHENLDALKALLVGEADVEEPTSDGMTLLHHAIDVEVDSATQTGLPLQVGLTRFLAQQGADLDHRWNVRNPLEAALDRGHHLAAQVLCLAVEQRSQPIPPQQPSTPLDGSAFVAALVMACPEIGSIVTKHLATYKKDLFLHLLVAEIRRFSEELFEAGLASRQERCLAAVGFGLHFGDDEVENAIAVSFVEDAHWWDEANTPYIATWPKVLADEVDRQRANQ